MQALALPIAGRYCYPCGAIAMIRHMPKAKPNNHTSKRDRGDALYLSSFPIPKENREQFTEPSLIVAGFLSLLMDDKCPPDVEEWAKLQGQRVKHRREKGLEFDPSGSFDEFRQMISKLP